MRKREDDYYTNWAFLHLYCDPSALIRPNRQVKRGNITPPYPLQNNHQHQYQHHRQHKPKVKFHFLKKVLLPF